MAALALLLLAHGGAQAFSVDPTSVTLTRTNNTWDAGTWTVLWEVPAASTGNFPLTAQATFTVKNTGAPSTTDLVLDVTVANTTMPPAGFNSERLTSFGFDITPTPSPLNASVDTINDGTGSDADVYDTVETGDVNLSGGYRVDVCVFAAKCNSDQGGGLFAGQGSLSTDVLTLTLNTGNFDSATYTLTTFAAKFQGDLGSFEVQGCSKPPCDDIPPPTRVPAPGTLALLFGALPLVLRRARQRT